MYDNPHKAHLKVVVGEYGAATLHLVVPILGDYRVVVTSDECLDSLSSEFGRLDEHRTPDAEVTMEYSQQTLRFHSELTDEQSLRIKVKDSTQEYDYDVLLMSPRDGDEVDAEEVITAENVEVEYIPYDHGEDE